MAAGLLTVFLAQSILSMRLLSATIDETTHLPSGYTYLKTGQLRLNPQHPPLVKLLSGLPLLALAPHLDLRDPAWIQQPPDEWSFGYRFLYSNDADRLLFWGRLPIVFLGALLGVYTFFWARDLFGRAAGHLALFLYVLCPNLIAHSHLVTMDVPLATFFVMTLYHVWRLARGGGRWQLFASGVSLGLALASKFSAVVLLPVLAALFAISALFRTEEHDGVSERRARGRSHSEAEPISRLAEGQTATRLARAAVAGMVIVAIALAVVWALYLFPTDPLFYFKSLRGVYADKNPAFEYYLLGEFKKEGWWYYFLLTFLFKTPVPTLVLVGLSVMVARKYPAPKWSDETFLVLPAVAFLGLTSAMAHNLGVRYLLPIYPLAFIFASRLAPLFTRGSVRRALAIVLAAWYVFGAVRIFPDHLAYFNELVGGPSRGFDYLDDSNLDWGQDLKRLKAWLDEKRIPQVYLGYSGRASPEYYGISYRDLTDQDLEVKPRPGVYAMSVMWLIRGRMVAHREGIHSDWLDRYKPIGRVGYSIYVYRFE